MFSFELFLYDCNIFYLLIHTCGSIFLIYYNVYHFASYPCSISPLKFEVLKIAVVQVLNFHQKFLADCKDQLERENQNILLMFEAQLNQSLKDLHQIIQSSVSQQEQQLRCVEECITTFLASKYEVRCFAT